MNMQTAEKAAGASERLDAFLSQPKRKLPEFAKAASWGLVPEDIRGFVASNILDVNSYPWYWHGDVGSGKTCALAALYAGLPWHKFGDHPTKPRTSIRVEAEPDGSVGVWEPVIWQFERLVRLITKTRFAKSRTVSIPRGDGTVQITEETIMAAIERAPIVMLDELGVSSPDQSREEWKVICDIADAVASKRLICTSNHNPDDLAAIYDDRVVSRLIGSGTVLTWPNTNRRNQGLRYEKI